ncbi:MAG: hypothetical protein M3478_10185, partial [Planctomycetota bacterium]|nr:hypothetical protein [Planctomycetota bacterium]
LSALAAIYPDHATDGKKWFRVEFSWEDAMETPNPKSQTNLKRQQEKLKGKPARIIAAAFV